MTFFQHLDRDKHARDTYYSLNNSQRDNYLKRWNEENKKPRKKKVKK